MEVADYGRDLLEALAAQDVPVELYHPEYAASQFEISIGPDDPVAAADRVILTRETVRAVSRRHGLRASFAPVPVADKVGNGMHLHMSMLDGDGRNLFADGDRARWAYRPGRVGSRRSARAFAGPRGDRRSQRIEPPPLDPAALGRPRINAGESRTAKRLSASSPASSARARAPRTLRSNVSTGPLTRIWSSARCARSRHTARSQDGRSHRAWTSIRQRCRLIGGRHACPRRSPTAWPHSSPTLRSSPRSGRNSPTRSARFNWPTPRGPMGARPRRSRTRCGGGIEPDRPH